MARLVSLNPVNGTEVGSVPITPVDEVPGVVERARKGQVEWGLLSLEDRRAYLLTAAQRIQDAADTVGRQLTEEMGKPLGEAVGEVRSCGSGLAEELDEMMEALRAETVVDAHTESTIFYDPLGVCVAITPWNFPFAMPHWLVLPALMAGNAVILKPSEETPLTAQAYFELMSEGLPDGVLQIVHGAEAQGKALVDAEVDMIAFTGSREVGKHILGQAAPNLRRVVLELGGKDPLVILDDADVARAAKFAARSSFRNAGQVCVSTERIYVPESIAEPFTEALVSEARKMAVGDGLEEGTRVGPMVSQRQRRHVLEQLEEAVALGARILTGGQASEVGNFLEPVVLDGVSHGMRIATEETFGPVAALIRCPSEDEAVRLANDTPFGLGAVVFGSDEERAYEVARRLDAGMVGVNRGVGGASGTPWIGARESGYGYHKSPAGHRQFTQLRVVSKRA